jgi:hypothetical protein
VCEEGGGGIKKSLFFKQNFWPILTLKMPMELFRAALQAKSLSDIQHYGAVLVKFITPSPQTQIALPRLKFFENLRFFFRFHWIS